MTDLLAAAIRYRDDFGFATMPLEPDPDGRPKKPFIMGWREFTTDDVESHPWERGVGIGILLGPMSANLAVIDLDSPALADRVLELLNASPIDHYFVRTGRQRGHLYLRERHASAPHSMRIDWGGEEHISVELKAQGQQVAAPPTEGYSIIGRGTVPVEVNTIAEAWAGLAQVLGIQAETQQNRGGAGYPRAWLKNVPQGDRNNAVYVEAHRLREAGMNLDSATDTMLARVSTGYDSGLTEREIVNTVRSAFKKPQGRGGYSV